MAAALHRSQGLRQQLHQRVAWQPAVLLLKLLVRQRVAAACMGVGGGVAAAPHAAPSALLSV
jgi:hypothetical protein